MLCRLPTFLGVPGVVGASWSVMVVSIQVNHNTDWQAAGALLVETAVLILG